MVGGYQSLLRWVSRMAYRRYCGLAAAPSRVGKTKGLAAIEYVYADGSRQRIEGEDLEKYADWLAESLSWREYCTGRLYLGPWPRGWR